jgi:NAD(P)H dehydrogenase (quinone)
MILVTGANGQLGTAVIAQLLKKTSANQIAAVVRDATKASAHLPTYRQRAIFL